MNAHQRKKHHTKIVAEMMELIDQMEAKDYAEILRDNVLLRQQIASINPRTRSRYKLADFGGNWFHLVPADEHAAAYLEKQERVEPWA